MKQTFNVVLIFLMVLGSFQQILGQNLSLEGWDDNSDELPGFSTITDDEESAIYLGLGITVGAFLVSLLMETPSPQIEFNQLNIASNENLIKNFKFPVTIISDESMIYGMYQDYSEGTLKLRNEKGEQIMPIQNAERLVDLQYAAEEYDSKNNKSIISYLGMGVGFTYMAINMKTKDTETIKILGFVGGIGSLVMLFVTIADENPYEQALQSMKNYEGISNIGKSGLEFRVDWRSYSAIMTSKGLVRGNYAPGVSLTYSF